MILHKRIEYVYSFGEINDIFEKFIKI